MEPNDKKEKFIHDFNSNQQGFNNNQNQNNKSPFDPNTMGPAGPNFSSIITVILIVMLINAIFVPLFEERRVANVSYDQFLNMIEEKKIRNVQIESDNIIFSLKDDNKGMTYKTGVFPDEKLVDRLKDSGASFIKQPVQKNSPLLDFLLFWILPMAIFGLIGRSFSRSMANKIGGAGGLMSIGKSNAKIYVENETGKNFEDVAGQDEAKEQLIEIIDFLHNPAKYTQIGAKLPKGALLVGPPGTGKTLIARAVAGEAKVPFFSISGSEFVEMFVGVGAAKVRDLFKEAEKKAPCIIFIDEIDAIGKKRSSNPMSGNDEREQTLNQLLTQMDGFDSNKGIVVLGATNRPSSLDNALLRPGRFDRVIRVELPDLKGREDILKVHARHVSISPEVNYNIIARSTPGASGAQLENIINEAALRAIRMGRKEVLQEDLQESVETVIAGAQKKNKILSDKERQIVSYHEVGHALVAAKQTGTAPVTKITIVPRTSGALGYTMQVEEEEKNLLSKQELKNKIATLLGGRAAEEVVFGSITTGASNDIQKATKIARSMITKYGMSSEIGMVALESENEQNYLGDESRLICSNETSSMVDKLVSELISNEYKNAKKILEESRADLDKISKRLIEKESITGEEFMQLLNENSLEETHTNIQLILNSI